ncbi:MAG: hypothetical protein Ta2F_04740 [Termitinemataceae bacterium]|nr:MAG: hypothetical protein Ta2F_04740 [Termitinemataceae bacterium]
MISFCPPVCAQTRTLDTVFPSISNETKKDALSGKGFSATFEIGKTELALLKTADSAVRGISENIISAKPSFVFESLYIIAASRNNDLLQVYRALSKVKNLQGRMYRSSTRKADIPLFEEATRIENEKSQTAIPDPQSITTLPKEEEIFIRVKDANFGNCFYKANININERSIFYSLTNNKNIYYFIPVIKKDKLKINLYIEPVSEGFLLYAVAGIDISDFIINNIDIPSAIQKRLNVIYGWIIDGIE